MVQDHLCTKTHHMIMMGYLLTGVITLSGGSVMGS